jgi:hypothetical protein
VWRAACVCVCVCLCVCVCVCVCVWLRCRLDVRAGTWGAASCGAATRVAHAEPWPGGCAAAALPAGCALTSPTTAPWRRRSWRRWSPSAGALLVLWGCRSVCAAGHLVGCVGRLCVVRFVPKRLCRCTGQHAVPPTEQQPSHPVSCAVATPGTGCPRAALSAARRCRWQRPRPSRACAQCLGRCVRGVCVWGGGRVWLAAATLGCWLQGGVLPHLER